MSASRVDPGADVAAPPLVAGDRLTRAEFERRYAAMPGVKKAELIEGVVYVPSPVSNRHARPHAAIMMWLAVYAARTPGLEAGDNATVRLDLDNEPQPDAYLRIAPARGGQSRDEEGYVAGAPELVAEVAVPSASYDLHDKLRAYRRNGVREYVVWRVADRALDWFCLRDERYEPLSPSPDGVLQSPLFPGLRLAVANLLDGDLARVLDVLAVGLATAEHAAFITRLSSPR